MHGRFRLTVLTPGSAGSTAVFHDISGPRAETATHYITMVWTDLPCVGDAESSGCKVQNASRSSGFRAMR